MKAIKKILLLLFFIGSMSSCTIERATCDTKVDDPPVYSKKIYEPKTSY